MHDRSSRVATFLEIAGWGHAAREPLAGDASQRRYERLRLVGKRSAVLMLDRPHGDGSVEAFLQMAQHLHELGFSAPEVIAEDRHQGLVLLEDLGDMIFKTIIDADPDLEPSLYRCAIDLLVELAGASVAGLPSYAAPEMAELADLAWTWYAMQPGDSPYKSALLDELATACEGGQALILRDYHAENLIWLPERSGIRRVGLLDFQDARLGPPLYDVVSLLTDARRDVRKALREEMMARYVRSLRLDPELSRRTAAILSVQRNLRILGVFARLCIRDGKPRYLAMLRRVWAYLQVDMEHPSLARLSDLVRKALPHPDQSHIDRLGSRCGQPTRQ